MHLTQSSDRRRCPEIRRSFLSRREWARRAGAFLAAGLAHFPGKPASAADRDPALIVRNRRPLDLETPVVELGSWLTPNDAFFVRSHLGEPAIGMVPAEVEVGGLVARPLRLTLDDLRAFDTVTVPAVLQCSGNGRAFFRPFIPGVAWARGAVGHAEWAGVRLSDVLEKAGLKPEAAHVHFLGADLPPAPKTPAYLRSLPLEKALAPSTILATAMNGEPLPHLHGGPLRLVVPGWTGNHWMKWVRLITPAAAEAPGFYMQTGYKIPKRPTPPDAPLKPSDLVSLTAMNVKSLVTAPAEGEAVPAGRVEVRGVAWTGEGYVTAVEVSCGEGGPWKPAKLLDPPRAGSWRRWSFALDGVAPGPVVVRARATDTAGGVQPETTPWNRSGYLWNGIDAVTFHAVRGA